MDMSVKLNLSYPAPAVQSGLAVGAAPSAPVPTVQEADKGKKPERAELEQAVSDIQTFVQSIHRQLEFSIDDTTGIVVVKVIASQSGEVVRQLPSEAALKLAQSLSDASSLLFDARA
ncbi:flagellar protein FlaG [compost metagenome]